MYAVRCRDAVDFEFRCQTVQRRIRGNFIECGTAAKKMTWIEITKDEIGVSDGGFGAAAAVAGWAGHRTGTFRADMQDAAGIDPADRSATGAQADDVEAVQ